MEGHEARTVADRFEIEAEIASGAMGSVRRARDRESGAPVALKMLRIEDPELARRFEREAQLLAGIDHPAIVRHVAHGRSASGERWLAMEWLEGETLSRRLDRGPLEVADCLELGQRVAEGLGAIHAAGIVHRDVKPSNVLLVDGDVRRPKLLDFGIARLFDARDAALTQTGALVGTPGYLSPEQARCDASIDARADVFSLGCVLFRCLAGRRPFWGADLLEILMKVLLEEVPRLGDERPDVPAALDDLLAAMLAKEREDRPLDGATAAEALDAIARGDARVSRPSGVPALTDRERRVRCVLLARVRGVAARDATLAATPFDPRDPALRAEVARHGGSLDLLADGSMLAVFDGTGAPTDAAARAAGCALAMRAMLPFAPLVLVTGWAQATERIPVGEVIDRATRALLVAEDAPVPSGRRARPIRLDDVTAALLDARFEVGTDDAGALLYGLRDREKPGRTLLGRRSPCVGRERELALLEAAYEECASESVARAVVVIAPPGVGKSRLRYELLDRLTSKDEPPEVWMARGDAIAEGAPFGMLGAALRGAFGLADGEALGVQRLKLRARLARHFAGAELARTSEFLGEIAGVRFPSSASVQLAAARADPQLMGDQMRRAWEDLVAAETQARPIVLVLEDLHWGDLPSVRLVDAALKNLSERPLLVVALARPEIDRELRDAWRERALTELRLSPLTRRASERLVREMLGAADDATVDAIVQRAAGNAFHLEELIRAVAEGPRAELPATVLATVQARLDGLPPEARRVLRAAAVFGQVFWRGALVPLLGGEKRAGQLDRKLAELVEKELVSRRAAARFAGEEEYVFRHALLQEGAYATLTDEDRALGHRLAAEWLAGAGERSSLVLAEHLERGGERARAVAWYLAAAREAMAGNDHPAAALRAERGVACGASDEARGELLQVQAEAHAWMADNARALARGTEAMAALAPGSAPWCMAAGDAATAAMRGGDYARLGEIVEALLALPAAGGGPWFMACARAASALLHAGRRDPANALLARVEAAAEASRGEHGPHVEAWIHRARAVRELVGGDPHAYVTSNAHAAAAFERAGDLRYACAQRILVGYGHIELGAHEEAARLLREQIAVAERLGLPSHAATGKHNLGLALAHLGRLDEARAVETEAVEAARAERARRLEGGSRIVLATIELLAGEPHAAEKHARAALEAGKDVAPVRCHALAMLARALLAEHDAPQALAHAEEAARMLEELGGIDWGEAFVRLVHAEALHAAGRQPEAARALADARAHVVQRAERISAPAWRESFLARVPENDRILALAADWTLP